MKSLPEVHEGDVLDGMSASVTEHFTTPRSSTRKTRSCLQWRLPETISSTMTLRRKVSEHRDPRRDH